MNNRVVIHNYRDGKTKPKVHKTMVLQQEELVQDIRNSAYIVADAVPTENPDDRGRIRDIAELNNRENMFRWMDLAVGMVANFLTLWSARYDRNNTLVSDRYKELPCYHIHMEVPLSFPENTFIYAKDLAHQFIVSKVLYEYLKIVFPDAAAVWKETMDDLEEKLRDVAKKQYGIVYRPFTPI